MKTNYKVVIFDFDGVLADTFDIFIKAINKFYYSREKKMISQEEVKKLRDLPATEIIKYFKIPFYKIPLMQSCVKREMLKETSNLIINPENKEVLNQVKQKQDKGVGIISSSSRKMIDNYLVNNQINFFDFICCGGHLFKKHKDILRAIKDNKVDSREAIMVGDEVRDVEAGRRAGVDVAAVTFGYNSKAILKKSKPDYLVDDFKDLLKII